MLWDRHLFPVKMLASSVKEKQANLQHAYSTFVQRLNIVISALVSEILVKNNPFIHDKELIREFLRTDIEIIVLIF